MILVNRAMLRGMPLKNECYRAYASKNEYKTDTVTVTGCYGLMSDRDNYEPECESCCAFVHGDIAVRVQELLRRKVVDA